jgi:hypothetical protein
VAGDLSVQPAKHNGNPPLCEGQVDGEARSEEATENKSKAWLRGEIRLIL